MQVAAIIARVGGLTLGALALAGAAFAQDSIPAGSVVRVKAVGKADAFFKQRKGIVGLVCGVEDPGLDPQSKKFYGGSMTCGEAGNFYFYQVAVELGDFGLDFETLTGRTLEASREPTLDSPWPVGARVRVRDVSADDSYHKDRAGIIGLDCTVKDSALSDAGEGWFSGQVQCDNGTGYYFYQVGVDAPGTVSAAVPTGALPAAAAESPFPAGKMVKVLDIGAADALYPTRTALVGRTCSVVEAPLVATGEGFYAGRLFCDDGKSYQGFMLKVGAP
ncbi:MAG: hypothetical protein Q8P18_30475 [Pseudomonadota bacterium]|nr:hypothetical protein [Pseudomonadota bacterium]